MRRRFAELNPTVRGFLLIALVVAIVFALQLERTLAALTILLRIAFLLAVAVFVYFWWRDRRSEIALWSGRSRAVFYGAALVLVVNLGSRLFYARTGSFDWLAFLAVFPLCGFAMWRVWRDEHTYGY